LSPTLETRFAPLSHLSRAASRLQPLMSREQVEIKASRRASPFETTRRKRKGVIQRTNGEAKENVYKRMSAQQDAQKTPRYLKKRRRGFPIERLRLVSHDRINRYRRNYYRVPFIRPSFLITNHS